MNALDCEKQYGGELDKVINGHPDTMVYIVWIAQNQGPEELERRLLGCDIDGQRVICQDCTVRKCEEGEKK